MRIPKRPGDRSEGGAGTKCGSRSDPADPSAWQNVAMPWLFLALSVLGAWITFNAFRPSSRWQLLGVSFFAAWLTGELAIWTIVGQAIVTAGFIALGALDSWPGWLGLAITLASWAGLLVLAAVSRRSGPVFDTALSDALGLDRGGSAAGTMDPVRVPAPDAGQAGRAHQEPRVRTARPPQPPRRLPAPRGEPEQPTGTGPPADPRRRLGHRGQEPAGTAAHAAPGRRGLGVRRDQLPPEPEGDVARAPGRLQARARRGSASTSPSTAATRTSSASPAARPAGTSRRWSRSLRTIRSSSPSSRRPTPPSPRASPSTASTTSSISSRRVVTATGRCGCSVGGS